ncbi:MAG: polysaccharide biosynthesis C-terminal domain-containing protein, partial [Planctomycetes bacterium]|nr:polysaccharide biosynthesis C-terminal domain-containing protein [Planctomycetota bacterium]
SAGVLACILDFLGGRYLPHFAPDVPFHPYLRLAIWGAFFQLPIQFLYNLLVTRENAGRYVVAATAVSLTTVTSVIYFVVVQRQGALGYLLGTTLASAICAGVFGVITARMARPRFRRDLVAPMLVYGLPLVPHLAASWILELSDRVLLKRFVSLEEVGVYSVGYQIGALLSIAAACLNNAWVPFLFQRLEQQGDEAGPGLARLVTYYVAFVSWLALGLVVFASHTVWLLTSSPFQGASRVVPWVVLGHLCSAVYNIPSNLLFAKGKSWLIPSATIAAGAANFLANLWLIPRYGHLAAAWVTFGSYGLMLLLVWLAATRVCPFPYEYRRLGIVVASLGSVLVVHVALPSLPFGWDAPVRTAIWLSYPVALVAFGFLNAQEQARIVGLGQRLRAGGGVRFLARLLP